MNKLVVINVLSKWHLYCAEAYLSSINTDMNNNHRVVAFIHYHVPSKNFRVQESDFNYTYLLDSKPSINFIKTSGEQKTVLRKVMSEELYSTLVMISPRQMNLYQVLPTMPIRKREYILVDEGIGNYYSRKLWNLESMALGNNLNKIMYIKQLIKKAVVSTICHHTTRWGLLKEGNKGWEPQDDVAASMRKYFDNYVKKIIDIDANKIEGDCVYLSDNLGIMVSEPEYEFDFYRMVYLAIRERYNSSNVWFKPHPNEKNRIGFIDRIKKIGFQVYEDTYAYENLCNSFSFFSFGLCSSSLLNGAVIFQRDVFSFSQTIKKDSLNEYGQRRIEEFQNITKNVSGLTRI